MESGHSSPSRRTKPNISFFFPAFNDAGTVEKLTVAAIKVLKRVANKYEVIIVNDGSLDNTGEVADRVARKYDNVIVKHHLYNIGYGAALKTGFYSSKYEWIYYTDGDMQFDPGELEKMVPLMDKADIISGYKIKRAEGTGRSATSWMYNRFVKTFLGIGVSDVDTAAKLIKREVIENIHLNLNGTFICAEILAKALKQHYRVVQVPVNHYPRTYGHSNALNLFFLMRSSVELMELWWNVALQEKLFGMRQKMLRSKYKRKRPVTGNKGKNRGDR